MAFFLAYKLQRTGPTLQAAAGAALQAAVGAAAAALRAGAGVAHWQQGSKYCAVLPFKVALQAHLALASNASAML